MFPIFLKPSQIFPKFPNKPPSTVPPGLPRSQAASAAYAQYRSIPAARVVRKSPYQSVLPPSILSPALRKNLYLQLAILLLNGILNR